MDEKCYNHLRSKSFYKALSQRSSNFCSCEHHLHRRPWIPPPCKTSSAERKNTCDSLHIANLEMAQHTKPGNQKLQDYKKITSEIKSLKEAEQRLEDGEEISESMKKLIDKWQKTKCSSPEKEKSKKSSKEKALKKLNPQTKDNIVLLSKLRETYEQCEKKTNEESNFKLLIKQNRRLRKKVKQLESEQQKDEEELENRGHYKDQSVTQKYNDLLSYVIKLEADNEHLKHELQSPRHSEGADDSAVSPFKQRIQMLEAKIEEQHEEILKLRSTTDHNSNQRLYEKLSHTQEVYERAINGYKEELAKLVEKCAQLQQQQPPDPHIDLKAFLKSMHNEIIDKIETFYNNGDQDQCEKIKELLEKYNHESTVKLYEEKLASKDEEIGILNRLFEEYKTRIEDLSDRLSCAKESGSCLEELTDVKKELVSEKKQSDNLTSHINTLKEQNANFIDQISHFKEQLSSTNKQIESKDSILQRVSLQLEQKIQECSSLTKQVSKLLEREEPKVDVMENQLQINDLQTQNKRLLAQISKVTSEKESLERKLKSDVRDLEEQVDRLTLKNSQSQRQLDTVISAYRSTFATDEGASPRTLFNTALNEHFPQKSS